MKDLLATICDAETGEILACTGTKNGKMPFGDGMRVAVSLDNPHDKRRITEWFNSFLRGLSLGRNLSLTLTIRDCKPITQSLDIL